MFDIVGVVALLVVVVVTVWLATRARRAGNAIVKWAGLVLSSLLALVFGLATVLALVGFYRINFPPDRPAVPDVHVTATPERLARGARFAGLCAGCHSPDGTPPLVGQDFLAEGGPPVGTLYAPNLTPAGEIRDWSDGELIRAIREGVHQSGRALLIMPSETFHNLSDDDVQAIVAYLRAQPATGEGSPPAKFNVLGAILLGAGLAPTSAQPPITQPVSAPPEGTSAEYGHYLVSVLACRECHGQDLAGRMGGGMGPPGGPNLTEIVPQWSVEDFVRTLRTGVDPNNHELIADMPWKEISTFADDSDLAAIYSYLHDLPHLPGPAR